MEEAWGSETRPQVCFNNGERFVHRLLVLDEMPKKQRGKTPLWVKSRIKGKNPRGEHFVQRFVIYEASSFLFAVGWDVSSHPR